MSVELAHLLEFIRVGVREVRILLRNPAYEVLKRRHVVDAEGVEPSSPRLKVECFDQLSYASMVLTVGFEPT